MKSSYLAGVAFIALVLISLVVAGPNGSREEPRIVNIVNFVREIEPRDIGVDHSNEVLYQTVVDEARVMKENGLVGTFLLQYDALIDPKYQELMKQEVARGCEVGGWWEITQPHVEAAGLEWRGRYPWDWYANVGFSTGYTQEERLRLVDVYMEKFKEIFGYYPESVGSWFIDAYSLDYMTEKYGIEASCMCRDQIGTDGYTIWGGYWDGAYYPSKKNSYMPAQTGDNQINVPMFRMLGSDVIHQHENEVDKGRSPGEILTMEPVNATSGGSQEWVDWYSERFAEDPVYNYAYTQLGQENSFLWGRIGPGFEIQMKRFAQLAKKGKVKVQTLGNTGKWFQSRFSKTPLKGISAMKDYRNGDEQALWFNTRHYRASILWKDGVMNIRDIHAFDENLESNYYSKPGQETYVDYRTVPVVDEALLVDPTDGLKVYLEGSEEPLSGTASIGRKFLVKWDTEVGMFKVRFHNRDIEITGPRKAEWSLKVKSEPSEKGIGLRTLAYEFVPEDGRVLIEF